MRLYPQFNDNLKAQFTEGKGQNGIRKIKTSEFENTRSHVKKKVEITQKKQTQHVRQIIHTKQRHLPTTVIPGTDFTDESVFQYDGLIVGNTFVNYKKKKKMIIDINNCKYILM